MRNPFKRKNKEPKGLVKYSYRDFLTLFPLCTAENRNEIIKALNEEQRPNFIAGKKVMDDLNGITYGQLDDLSRIKTSPDPLAAAFEILLGLPASEVYALPVTTVFGFGNFATKEVERINKLFSDITLEHTADEVSAGINELNFGSFGVLDWYARRMRITNQNEVRSVPWVRIYTCMKNDTAQVAYERRYNQVIINKSKNRKG